MVYSIGKIGESGLYFAPQLPHGFDHFCRAGLGGEPTPPHSGGWGGEPSLSRGEWFVSIITQFYADQKSIFCHKEFTKPAGLF